MPEDKEGVEDPARRNFLKTSLRFIAGAASAIAIGGAAGKEIGEQIKNTGAKNPSLEPQHEAPPSIPHEKPTNPGVEKSAPPITNDAPLQREAPPSIPHEKPTPNPFSPGREDTNRT